MKVLVVFTFDYSLMTWKQSGTLEKELNIYKEIAKKEKIEFIFLTYGDEGDLSLINESIKIVPVYKYFKFSNNRFIRYLHSFLVPIKLRQQIGSFDLIKQNQLLGSWTSIMFKLLYRKPLFIRTGYDMYKFSVYEKKKKQQQSRKRQHVIKVKEIRLRPTIDEHDLMTKLNQGKKFLADGAKLKITLMFRGREMSRIDLGRDVMERVFQELEDVAEIEKDIPLEGRRMSVILNAK